MNHGSLFSGIGGFDLAAEWMGWNNTFHCEWMPFPRKVLSHYFPKSISYEDITKTDFSIHRGTIDILTGGFPCQPYSSAGKRLGKEDERHLWPHMLRVISEIKPTYVVGENVRGLTNWNGGVVFEEVCVDLESQGYEIQPILLPACAVGAPHRRDRVWFIAKNTKRNGFIQRESEQEGTEIWEQRNACTGDSIGFCLSERNATNTECFRLQHSEKRGDIQESTGKTRCERSEFTESIEANGSNGYATNTNSIRHNRHTEETRPNNSNSNRMGEKIGQYRNNIWSKTERCSTNNSRSKISNWETFPTQSPICGGDDGLPTKLDGITFSKWRQESIKGYGNAIVPQVAYEIFKVIAEMDRLEKLQLTLF
jgi:DNA (cytosine-5)-methyltransferase 1